MSLHGISLLLTAILLGKCQCDNSSCGYNDVIQSLSNIPGNYVRPVKDWRVPTMVNISMALYTVISLETSLQTMTSYVWFTMAWQNEFISWNPDNYCGIEEIIIPGDSFWLPDLYIYELTASDSIAPVVPFFMVSKDGTINNLKPLRIVSSCNLDIFQFPFDTQTCTLSFGPYTHEVQEVTMISTEDSSTADQESKDIFISKGDWSLVSVSVKNQNYTVDEAVFSQVKYQIIVKRAPVVYVINLIVPACFLVILDVSSMFIAMNTGERLGFKITVVLGFSVLLLILNDMLPNSDNPPVLGIFCCVCLATMVISIIGSIFTSYMLSLAKSHPTVPNWIEVWIMKHLARVLLFKDPQRKKLSAVDTVANSEDKKPKPGKSIEMKRQDSQRDSMRYPTEVKLLKRLLAEVQNIHKDLLTSQNQEEAKSDWHFAAVVVDRLILIVYLVIVIIMFAVVINTWSKTYLAQ